MQQNELNSLDVLSTDELRELERRVSMAITEHVLAAGREVAELAQRHGIDLRALANPARTYSPRAPTAARLYVDPKDQNRTWTGLGRRPGWVTEMLADGTVTLDQLLKR